MEKFILVDYIVYRMENFGKLPNPEKNFLLVIPISLEFIPKMESV